MEKYTRKQFQERLADWRSYPHRFHSLAPMEQHAFLQRQGYASLNNLLAHIVAWWQDGVQNIQKMRADPSLPLGEYNVDAFNARAVEKYRLAGEPEMVAAYEAQRQAMLVLVSSLSDTEIRQENINTRLYYEILSHWTEHQIP